MFYKLTKMKSVLTDDERTRTEKVQFFKEKLRKQMLGSNDRSGLIGKTVVYTLLICIGFVYLYPLLYMFVTSIKSLADILDSAIKWIPSKLYLNNYKQALTVMKFNETIVSTLKIALIPTVFQVVICSFVGFGFARYEFWGKKLFMGLMIFTFIIPPQITMMPTYTFFSDLRLIGSLNAFILPAATGQGFKSAIFILIFYQFYRQTPKALYEAAQIDGAGHLSSYFKIAIPSAIPAIIVAFLFSFVWYWNETYLVTLYLGGSGIGNKSALTTILIQLQNFDTNYNKLYPVVDNGPNRINEAIKMAGTIISIAPLLITYFFTQKHFVESVDRTGITGE